MEFDLGIMICKRVLNDFYYAAKYEKHCILDSLQMGGRRGDKGLEIMRHTSHKLMASDPLGCPTEEQAIPEGGKLLITRSVVP